MAISANYDDQADALYLRIREENRVRTEEFDDCHYVDVGEDGDPVGIEILYPDMGLALEEIAERYGLQSILEELLAAARAVHTPAMATYTAATQVLGAPYSLVLNPVAPAQLPEPASRSSSVPPEVVVS